MRKHCKEVIVTILLLVLVGCDMEPPEYIPRSTREFPESAGAFTGQSSLADSPTVLQMLQKGYFKYGTPLAAPYAFIRPGPNDFLGINSDLAALINEQLGFPGPLVQLQRWPQMPTDLESGIVGLIIGGPVARPEFQGLAFIEIGVRGYCLLAAEGDTRFQEVEHIRQPGIVFGVVEGTDVEHRLLTEYPEVELLPKQLAIAEVIVSDLLEGEVDVTAVYASLTPVLMGKYPGLAAFPAGCAEAPIWPTPWGISVRNDDPLFHEFLAGLVASLRETGWFEDRATFWIESPRLLNALSIE